MGLQTDFVNQLGDTVTGGYVAIANSIADYRARTITVTLKFWRGRADAQAKPPQRVETRKYTGTFATKLLSNAGNFRMGLYSVIKAPGQVAGDNDLSNAVAVFEAGQGPKPVVKLADGTPGAPTGLATPVSAPAQN